MKRKLNSIVLFFCITFSFAQIDVRFIDHLATNNLTREHISYLNSFTPESDSILYFKARFYIKYPNDSLFLHYYLQCKSLCNADTFLLNTAGNHFLKNTDPITQNTWFNSQPKNTSKTYDVYSSIYKASLNPGLYSKDTFPPEFQKAYLTYKRAYNKKPLLAAMLSILLPGSGKLYAGKTKTFFLTFLLSAAYSLQTAESAQKLGIKHPLSIINAGVFTVFYLSNIYGSYRAVIDLKKERKKQFLTDAANFYN